jgi:hypothetical protein
MEDVDREAVSIEQVVQTRTGRRPQLPPRSPVSPA